jgi:hypothetical protein
LAAVAAAAVAAAAAAAMAAVAAVRWKERWVVQEATLGGRGVVRRNSWRRRDPPTTRKASS